MKINKLIISLFAVTSIMMLNPYTYVAFIQAAQAQTIEHRVVVMSDADITSNVKNKISATSSLSSSNIQVSTKDGVVKLSGKVDSIDQLTTVTELAQATTGVTDVDTSDVKITNETATSNQPFTDTLITAKIKGMFVQKQLFSNTDISSMSISVETTNGVVSLSGTADNQTQIDNAIKIAKSIKGVTEVKSTVTVKVPTTT